MNPCRRPRRVLIPFLLATSVGLRAQAPVREPVPDPAAGRPPASREPDARVADLPLGELVVEVEGVPPSGDAPDFAPMEEVVSADGRHTSLRPRGNPYVLSFAGGDYTPEPGIDPALLERQRANPAGHTYGYIMIEGRMADAKLARLGELGVKVLDVHTWQSVVARIPLARVQALRGLPFVRWIGYPRSWQKLGRRLARRLGGGGLQGEQPMQIFVNLYESDAGPDARVVRFGAEQQLDGGRAVILPSEVVFPGGPVETALRGLGFVPDFYDPDVHTFRGTASRAQIEAIRALDSVRSLEVSEPHHSDHDQSMAMIGQDRIRGTWPGAGVAVGIIDTGIDSSPWHQDFTGKAFIGFKSIATLPSPFEDGEGHGTHVAGTVFGRGLADKRYTGAAPAVGNGGEGNRIFIGRYLNDSGSGVGLPKILYDQFKQSHTVNGKSNPKPSVVNNSWGNPDQDGYDGTEYSSRTVDDIVYHDNQTYVFTAGNKGTTANWWAGSPGCAKNVLTVGATTDRWDGANRPGKVASFSRSNTKDGRRKPEICAPGDLQTSTRLNTSISYMTLQGTSMAAPMVTGAVASLIERDSYFRYFPAAVKAAMVASASNDGTLYAEAARGFGQIDCYKLNKAGKTTYNVLGGTLTRTGNWLQADIPISANLRAIRVTLVMIEPAASSLATAARRNDIRLWLDAPPYAAGGESGIWSKSSPNETVISHSSYISGNGGLAQLVAGKTIRVKAFAKSIKALDDVKVAVSVIQYLKHPDSTSRKPTLTVTKSHPAARPNQAISLDAELRSESAADDFTNARVWLNSPASFAMTNMARTTGDSILHNFTSLNLHPSFNFPNVGIGSSRGMAIGTGHQRRLRFDLTVPAIDGVHNLDFRATYGAGDAAHSITKVVGMCVDSKAPNQVAALNCTSHSVGVWSNDPTIHCTWIKASDNGCAGIARQHYALGTGSPAVPISTSPSVAPAQGWANITTTTSASGRYFSVRAVDNAGWWAPVASVGPFLIDTLKPILNSVIVNDGATYTDNLLVRVKLPYNDPHSGVGDIRYSMNGTNWSPWEPHSSQGQWVLLSNAGLGGTIAEGVKKVYAQIRDRAGNVSSTKTGSIEFRIRPKLNTATISSVPSVSWGKYYRLEGEHLDNVQSISFGNRTVSTHWTSAHDSYWVNGSWRRFGTTVIWFYPPQGLAPGAYNVRLNGYSSASSSLPLQVTAHKAPILRSGKTYLANGEQTLMVARGNMPVDSTAVILASTSNTPSILKGVYEFGIGDNFRNLLILPGIGFPPLASHRTFLSFPVIPALVGNRVYFQAAFLARSTLPVWPMPVTDVWTTEYVQ